MGVFARGKKVHFVRKTIKIFDLGFKKNLSNQINCSFSNNFIFEQKLFNSWNKLLSSVHKLAGKFICFIHLLFVDFK